MMPFEIDRKSWVKLPHQVADGIRRCIVDGVWKPGDKLPSARALASELGVSFRVAVEACGDRPQKTLVNWAFARV